MKPGALAPLFAEVFCSTAALEALNDISSEVPLVGGMFSKLAQVRAKTDQVGMLHSTLELSVQQTAPFLFLGPQNKTQDHFVGACIP